MTIRADLHVHAKVCKSAAFDHDQFRATVERARRVGLDGFALTEHIDAPGFWEMLFELRRVYPYRGGRLSIGDGLGVLTGAELTVAEGADAVLIGDLEALGAFDRSFDAMPSRGHRPPLSGIFGPAREAGLVVIAAHPTRSGKCTVDVGRGLLDRFDAMEVNGKDEALSRSGRRVSELAGRLGLPVVGGSDAHVWPQVGVVSTVMEVEELTQEGLRRSLAGRTTSVETAPGIASLVRISKAHRSIVRRRIAAAAPASVGRMGAPIGVPVPA